MTTPMRVLVTGGAGFIGSAVVRYLAAKPATTVVNLDKLTYAGNPASIASVSGQPNYRFYRADICDEAIVRDILVSEKITHVMHLAAESHVDRSIDRPDDFIQTNVVGTCRLLSAAHWYWRQLSPGQRDAFRFLHVSTDEVFGDLDFDDSLFTEDTPYNPSSPYSASKAASDHFVRAWHTTYGLPIVMSNCSNNYGPYHYPEKLIPLVILNALQERELPIYGRGENVRDWLFVEDHVLALEQILLKGRLGESYNVGGRSERTNLEVVQSVCDILDRLRPLRDGTSRRDLIRFVADRPSHDRRYAIDASKLENELGWKAKHTFEAGLERTIEWYLGSESWWRPIRERHYTGERLGLIA